MPSCWMILNLPEISLHPSLPLLAQILYTEGYEPFYFPKSTKDD